MAHVISTCICGCIAVIFSLFILPLGGSQSNGEITLDERKLLEKFLSLLQTDYARRQDLTLTQKKRQGGGGGWYWWYNFASETKSYCPQYCESDACCRKCGDGKEFCRFLPKRSESDVSNVLKKRIETDGCEGVECAFKVCTKNNIEVYREPADVFRLLKDKTIGQIKRELQELQESRSGLDQNQ